MTPAMATVGDLRDLFNAPAKAKPAIVTPSPTTKKSQRGRVGGSNASVSSNDKPDNEMHASNVICDAHSINTSRKSLQSCSRVSAILFRGHRRSSHGAARTPFVYRVST